MELWTKKIAILYISTCDLPWKPPVRQVGSVPGEERVLEPNPSCRGEIFGAEGLEQWKVLPSVEGQLRVQRQWSCVPAGENHLLPTGDMFIVLFVVSKRFKVNTRHLWDTPEVLSQYFISLPVSVDKSESCCENMGVLVSSIALRKVCQPCHF